MAFFILAVGLTKSTAFFLGATHMAQIARKQNFVERYNDIWQLAYPNIVTMMLHNVMSIIDTIMVSQVSMAALAGVSLAQLVLATLFYLYRGVAEGVLTFSAQYTGAKRDHHCGPVAWQGLYIGVGIGALILLMIPLVQPLFEVMKPSEAAMGPGIAYLRIALIGGSVGALTLILSYFLRGLGDSKTPMRIAVLGNGVNVVGNYLLIFGHAGFPRLGVVGAAISTSIAECLVLVLLLRVFWSAKIDARYATRRWAQAQGQEMRRLAKLAFPLSLQGLFDVGSFTLFTVMIGRMGTAQLALSHIVLRLIVFAFLPVQGLAVAAATLVGQHLGAQQPARAAASGRYAIHLGVVYMGGLGLLFICMPQVLLGLFTRDDQVVGMGVWLLRLLGAIQIFDALYWVCSGVLKGAGDTRWILVVSGIYNWLVFLPLAFVLGVALGWGVFGAWVGFAVMVLLQGGTFWWRFHQGRWQALSILSPDHGA